MKLKPLTWVSQAINAYGSYSTHPLDANPLQTGTYLQNFATTIGICAWTHRRSFNIATSKVLGKLTCQCNIIAANFQDYNFNFIQVHSYASQKLSLNFVWHVRSPVPGRTAAVWPRSENPFMKRIWRWLGRPISRWGPAPNPRNMFYYLKIDAMWEHVWFMLLWYWMDSLRIFTRHSWNLTPLQAAFEAWF